MYMGKILYVYNTYKKQITQDSYLVEYNKTIRDEKPHECNICGKTFEFVLTLVVGIL